LVTEAANSDEGFKKAREEKPNLVIADVLMPIKDGYPDTHIFRDWAAS